MWSGERSRRGADERAEEQEEEEEEGEDGGGSSAFSALRGGRRYGRGGERQEGRSDAVRR